MAEQIIDIRERIEKMRIKFEDDQKSDLNDVSNDEKKVVYEKTKEITSPYKFTDELLVDLKLSDTDNINTGATTQQNVYLRLNESISNKGLTSRNYGMIHNYDEVIKYAKIKDVKKSIFEVLIKSLE